MGTRQSSCLESKNASPTIRLWATSPPLQDSTKKGQGDLPWPLDVAPRFDRFLTCSHKNHLFHRRGFGYFLFPSARRDFTAAAVSSYPDLAQEVMVTIAMEDELGLARFLGRCARNGQHRVCSFRVQVTDGEGWSLMVHRP